MIMGPILTEKATGMSERQNKVTFRVQKYANKHQIRDEVQRTYNVTVTSVHTLVVHGKLKRRGSSVGRRPKWKKAIVSLKQGDVIDFYRAE